MVLNIAFEYIGWHFVGMPIKIIKAWRNILLFNVEYFSVLLLLKTLFAPWRRIAWSAGGGFNIGGMVEVFFSNLISRILGALIRSILVTVGLMVEAMLCIIALLSMGAWLLLPFLIVAGFFYGITIFF